MIPEFPNFKKLELADGPEIDKFTSKYPPYSDFNFASMWSWDIHNNMAISQLNKNLVILFNDYVLEKKFLSLIGENKISETASELTSFSEKNYKMSSLELIPEEAINMLNESMFIIVPDRDSYDYIYSMAHLANMNNWSKNSSGKRIRRFLKSNPNYVIKDLRIEEIPKEEYKIMFQKWAQNKNIDNHFGLNEYKAFERFLQMDSKKIKFTSLYINGVLVGFTAYEILSNDFAISHFAKADIEQFSGVYDVLNWEEARLLNKKGIKYFNWEQDLGISGLRYSKEKYKHSFFLKKFIVNRLV
jgi:hypothetical protein